ncbi:hypothetical protein F9L69_16485 [Brucella melitensis]|nr:hypothetical protein CT124_11275 [Brucella melitensis]AUS59267.1 hypothetical protein C1A46_16450 [Brucella abortus]AUS48140.1 hypothetical protein C0R52_12165 [Brucella melitensis]AUS56120.1 hypothetical protein CX678_16450 [Brucella melitensis]AVM32790.1 hypothetical protein CUC12_16435 [Brucella melitensis]
MPQPAAHLPPVSRRTLGRFQLNGPLEPLQVFVSSHFSTQNRFTLLLEMLYLAKLARRLRS